MSECCRCHKEIHRDDITRYMGDRVAHDSSRCIELLRMENEILHRRIEELEARDRWVPVEEQEPPKDENIDILAIVVCSDKKTIRRASLRWEPVHRCWSFQDNWPQEGLRVLKWKLLPPEKDEIQKEVPTPPPPGEQG